MALSSVLKQQVFIEGLIKLIDKSEISVHTLPCPEISPVNNISGED